MLCLCERSMPGARGFAWCLGALLALVCALALAACAPTEDTTYLTPPAEATLDAFNWDWTRPIETKLDAVIVGTSMLDDGRRVALEPLQILYVGKSDRNEAVNRLYNTAGKDANGNVIKEDSNYFLPWLGLFTGAAVLLTLPVMIGVVIALIVGRGKSRQPAVQPNIVR